MLDSSAFLFKDYDAAEIATEKFLTEENDWKEALSRRLDAHIGDLQASSEAIIEKYTATR